MRKTTRASAICFSYVPWSSRTNPVMARTLGLEAVAVGLLCATSWIDISKTTASAMRCNVCLLAVNKKQNRSEEHTFELQSLRHLVCRLLLEKKNMKYSAASEGHCRSSCTTPAWLRSHS